MAAAGTMVEAGHVDVLAADTAVVPCRCTHERREVSGDVEADLLAQVAADDVGAVAEPVRMAFRSGIQQDARRIDTARADHDDLGERFTLVKSNPGAYPADVALLVQGERLRRGGGREHRQAQDG